MTLQISIHTRVTASYNSLSTLLLMSASGPTVILHLARTPTAQERIKMKCLIRKLLDTDESQASLERAARAASLLLRVAS